MEDQAAKRIDSGFTQYDAFGLCIAAGEVSKILARSRCHTSPCAGSGSSQFGADGYLQIRSHNEDGIGVIVRLKVADTDNSLDQFRLYSPCVGQIPFDEDELVVVWGGQFEHLRVGDAGRRHGCCLFPGNRAAGRCLVHLPGHGPSAQ